jgi:TPR repeat protein
MHRVGVCYAWRRVWGTDFRKAVTFYKYAAARGNPWAMFDLARVVWYRKNIAGRQLSIALFKRCAELALGKCMDALVRTYTNRESNLKEAAYCSLESGRFGGMAKYYPKRKDYMNELQMLLTRVGLYSGNIDGEDTPLRKQP